MRLQNEHQNPEFPSLLRLTPSNRSQSNLEAQSKQTSTSCGRSDHTSLIEFKLFKQNVEPFTCPKSEDYNINVYVVTTRTKTSASTFRG